MEELIQSIYDSPQDWSITEYTLSHNGGYQLWVKHGFLGCSSWGSGMSMTLIQKIRIWKAYKWWCSNAPISAVR